MYKLQHNVVYELHWLFGPQSDNRYQRYKRLSERKAGREKGVKKLPTALPAQASLVTKSKSSEKLAWDGDLVLQEIVTI